MLKPVSGTTWFLMIGFDDRWELVDHCFRDIGFRLHCLSHLDTMEDLIEVDYKDWPLLSDRARRLVINTCPGEISTC